MGKAPSLQFYPGDWQRDTGLKMCSLAARGLWVEMMWLMFDGDPYGHLSVKGSVIPPDKLGVILGVERSVVDSLLAELEQYGVFSRTEAGVIYSRRMVSDRQRREINAVNGAKGGNPRLSQSDKPKVKPRVNPLRADAVADSITQEGKERAGEKTPFDSWWSLYRKGSRKLSAEQWDRMAESDRLACIAATPAYLKSKPDPTFRKDGERFLKHRTWEDPIVEPTATNGNGHAQTWGGHDAAYWDRFRAEFQAAHGRGPSSGDPKELVPPGYKLYKGWT